MPAGLPGFLRIEVGADLHADAQSAFSALAICEADRGDGGQRSCQDKCDAEETMQLGCKVEKDCPEVHLHKAYENPSVTQHLAGWVLR